MTDEQMCVYQGHRVKVKVTATKNGHTRVTKCTFPANLVIITCSMWHFQYRYCKKSVLPVNIWTLLCVNGEDRWTEIFWRHYV